MSSLSLAAGDLTLWYNKPAQVPIEEALAIGNGKIGALICGDPSEERLVLNEHSLWTGGDNPSGDDSTMGDYQCLANLYVSLPSGKGATAYRRDLNIGDSLSHVSYESGGVRYRREYFASHPAGVIVTQFSASKPHSYTGTVDLKDAHDATATSSGAKITLAGRLKNGLKYECQTLVLHEGGEVWAENGKLNFKGCDSLTFLISAGTDYSLDSGAGYRGADPHEALEATIASAQAVPYERLRDAHLKDFHSMFQRVSLDLGTSSASQKAAPFDERKIAAATTVDPELDSLFFQYGRYLIISCSRPGGLPANLQGLWNDTNSPPWHSDYHTNINVEMNYWPVEVTNLTECHVPLFDMLLSQTPVWRKATALSDEMKTPSGEYTKTGWAVRTSHNIYGGMGWRWDHTANAWYCQHLWEHYAFTQDKAFLSLVAYPLMRETVEFWEEHLKTLPDGRVVVPNAWSPEHGPTEDGVSYSQEIVWDLFTNYIDAADALSIDLQYRKHIEELRSRLATPGVGSWGQLMEWMTEKKGAYPEDPNLDTPNDHHRHTSHLFGVFPGRQIGIEKEPKLAAAAKVSLDARGETGDVREWSFAWRAALYARLHDGESAHRMMQQLFSKRNTCVNLFGLHPPMQMDGNFGITAGMAEMLLQSHEGDVSLLPALPAAWPTGSVRGLKARGAFTVDIAWKDGKLTSWKVAGPKGAKVDVKYGDKALPMAGRL
jgi:alpha-L-fucosidase 2